MSAELSGETRIVLEFEGIDTAATITANDQIVGTTDNMFVKYYFDITDAVKVRKTTLLSSMNFDCDIK